MAQQMCCHTCQSNSGMQLITNHYSGNNFIPVQQGGKYDFPVETHDIFSLNTQYHRITNKQDRSHQ